MIKRRFFGLIVVMLLSISLFACSAKENSKPTETDAQAVATEVVVETAAATEPPASKIETEFPVLPDAENMMDAQGTLIYQTATKMTDVFDFYKTELTAKGLTENEILTLTDETVSQLVFTGSENGKSLIVQMTKLSETSVSVAIRYE
ncbi:MAG: hypothetical protein CVU43_03175 [Chloroflexi bacterium HGW-Chloroflexi-5]|jgi:hypothetical protein|nr:MAG: hypothetical protein CVU43_03175 [Chloroflexi bacterium HGW-Chloroflexi-5]